MSEIIGVDVATLSPTQASTAEEKPTALLRWNDGVLEQRIELKEWNHLGDLITWTTFWRPVPTFSTSTNEASHDH